MALGPDPTLEITCRVCRGPFEALPDSVPLWLRCPENHFQTIGELLDEEGSLDGRRPPGALALWGRRAAGMRERAAEAVQQRNPVMAAGFLDAALRIEDWVRKSAPRPAGRPAVSP